MTRPDRLSLLLNAPLPNVNDMLGLSARIVFASVLAGFFWASAMTKLDGFGLSANAYVQILPRQMEQAGYDPSALGLFAHVIVLAGTLAEFLLPLLIILGLLTRPAALAMIGFVAVMTLTDIAGHGVGPETIGRAFDRQPDSPIMDQRLLWVWLLAVLAASGGGWLSLDRLLFGRRGQTPR